jgi:hypothetical protein
MSPSRAIFVGRRGATELLQSREGFEKFEHIATSPQAK